MQNKNSSSTDAGHSDAEYESRDFEAPLSSSFTGSPYDSPVCSPTFNPAGNYSPEAIGGKIKYEAKTGHVLVIDNCTAVYAGKSASFRVQRLLDLYGHLGFTIQRCNNLTKSTMLKVLEDTAKKDFSVDDCFVCVIVSHGSVEGEIYGTDGGVINLEAITSLFNCSRCPQLEEKPKIFLIEAFQEAGPAKIPSSGPFSSASFLEGDFLICYACSPAPAVFLTFIAQVFKECSGEEHILDMMLRVNRIVERHFKMQRSWQLSTLTKNVYFSFS